MIIAAIIQARVGSSRLPGKIFERVGGQTMLTHVLARAKAIPGVALVAVTTTPAPEDDTIVARCYGGGVACTRGQVPLADQPGRNDVLNGYLTAALAARADVVVRITSDCPLLDPAVAGAVLARFLAAPGCAYASNVHPPSWYDGCDVEVFSVAALVLAARCAAPDEREHVTTWLWRGRDPACGAAVNVAAPDGADYSALKLSVDTLADLARVRRVYAALPSADRARPGWRAVLAAYRLACPAPLDARAQAIFSARPELAPVRAAYADGARAGAAATAAVAVRRRQVLGAEDSDTLGFTLVSHNPFSTASADRARHRAWALGWEDTAVLGHGALVP